eukprot:11355784-Ditylum_brightwellii.AAC.1
MPVLQGCVDLCCQSSSSRTSIVLIVPPGYVHNTYTSASHQHHVVSCLALTGYLQIDKSQVLTI